MVRLQIDNTATGHFFSAIGYLHKIFSQQGISHCALGIFIFCIGKKSFFLYINKLTQTFKYLFRILIVFCYPQSLQFIGLRILLT